MPYIPSGNPPGRPPRTPSAGALQTIAKCLEQPGRRYYFALDELREAPEAEWRDTIRDLVAAARYFGVNVRAQRVDRNGGPVLRVRAYRYKRTYRRGDQQQ